MVTFLQVAPNLYITIVDLRHLAELHILKSLLQKIIFHIMMRKSIKLVLLLGLALTIFAQNIGTQKQEYHVPMGFFECSAPGQCQQKQAFVTLDSNWRWTHSVNGYQNCYTGNTWDSSLCPDENTCTRNCAVDGVPSNEWANPYGITQISGGIKMKLVTHGQYGDNIGARVYLLENDERYRIFKLKNREFSFDVDVSELQCGINGALYFVEMEADGGKSSHPDNKAGAKYGTGYCDAQCPHDMKWIYGQANSKNWTPSPKDRNSGSGHYGTCCAEMDIWEANRFATQLTAHSCNKPGYYRCEGVDCGDNDKGQRQDGVCDKDGCDFNPYRMGDKTFYGPNEYYQVDTTKPFQVVTQFITSDGTDNGDLVEIRRFYVQNGKRISNSKTNVPGLGNYDSLSDNNCNAQKNVFSETNKFQQTGGLKNLGKAMERGMVLVLSLWDDHDVNMLWLDSDFPLDKDPSAPGVGRGPCPRDSGNPEDVERRYGDATVSYSNVRFGPINSTFKTDFEE